ncbi:hypothetical protein K0M31_003703 [Melipona bicolor]|uniref:Uncharacterized protein n=1 Tax=Melipona bicolor TaxID=60889 RepID=A0AA40KNU8_9HYME|nr:hypothetical protein K0M31_003703 [Melipona bicolor]
MVGERWIEPLVGRIGVTETYASSKNSEDKFVDILQWIKMERRQRAVWFLGTAKPFCGVERRQEPRAKSQEPRARGETGRPGDREDDTRRPMMKDGSNGRRKGLRRREEGFTGCQRKRRVP